MLAYRFPPASNAIASRRPEALYKYLPQYGWEPRVLTTQDDADLPGVMMVADRSIAGRSNQPTFEQAVSKAAGLKAQIRSVGKRVARLSPLGYDAYARWSWDAAAEGFEVGDAEKLTRPFSLVWATLSPLSLAPAAVKLAHRLSLPCILDLRDPPDEALGSLPRGWFTTALRKADSVIVAAPSCVTTYVADNCKPVLSLSGAWQTAISAPVQSNEFRILHAGTWHPHYESEILFQAVISLAAESSAFAATARLAFVGKGSELVRQTAAYELVKDMVEIQPLIPHEQVRHLIEESSVLLIARSCSGYKARAITGKIFEYAPYAIPLLSIGGEDDLHAQLVRWLGGTWANDVEPIKGLLRSAFAQWQSSGVTRAPRNPEALNYLTQQRMAAETASVLDAVVEKREVPVRSELPWEH